MQLQQLPFRNISCAFFLLLNIIHGVSPDYAITRAKISALQLKQIALERNVADCKSAAKAEPDCTSTARDETNKLLMQTKAEIGQLHIEVRAGKNERASIWNEKQKRFITSRLSVDDALSKNLGYVSLDGAMMFFETDAAFRHWLTTTNPPDPLTAKVEYASGKSAYIKTCQANSAASDRKRHVVYTARDPMCPTFGVTADYQVHKSGNLMQIDLTRKLVYKGTGKNFDSVKKKIDEAQGCIRDIYANQGIRLNFNYTFERSGSFWNSAGEVYIYDEHSHSNASHWGILANQGTANTSKYLCISIAHEMGHLLGLFDTYRSPECPKRPPAWNPNDLMQTSNVPPEASRLNEREIKKILEPLCGEKADTFPYVEAGSSGYAAEYGSFVSLGLGIQKFIAPVADFGYVVSAGLTSVSDSNGFAEIQLNYSQPGLNLTRSDAIQDNFHFGYSQAILNLGLFFSRAPFAKPGGGQGSGNPFLGLHGGVGLHIWHFSRETQEKVTGNNPFANNQLYPNNRTAWVADVGVSFFIIRQLQLRLQYTAILMATKPNFQTVTLMLQYNIF